MIRGDTPYFYESQLDFEFSLLQVAEREKKEASYKEYADEVLANPHRDWLRLKEKASGFLFMPKTKAVSYPNKNRYSGFNWMDERYILPPDETLVSGTGYLKDFYVNASRVSLLGTHFLVAQGPIGPKEAPKLSTVPEFCLMLFQEEPSLIVNAAMDVEGGVNKCFCYWKEASKEAGWRIGSESYAPIKEGSPLYEGVIIVEAPSGKIKKIPYLHHTEWRDHSAASLHILMELGEEIEKRERTSPYKGAPLIHCSAGVGRSGVIASYLAVSRHLERASVLPEDLKDLIDRVVLDGRRQRQVQFVQTPKQLELLYKALFFLAEKSKKNESRFPFPEKQSPK